MLQGGRGKALVSLGKALKVCKEAALWQQSLLHLQEFRRLHEPDAAALDAATIACSRRNRWDLAVFLLRQRWEIEGPSWKSAFNPGCGASISACARAGHWDLALALFAEARVRPGALLRTGGAKDSERSTCQVMSVLSGGGSPSPTGAAVPPLAPA